MSVQTLLRGQRGLPSVLDNIFEPWNDWFTDNRLTKQLTIPKVNIREDKDNYHVSVAAPGLQKEDFKISTDGNILTIGAESESNKETGDENYSRREYNYSSFSRSFTLPEDVEKDKIEAKYDSGVLTLELPRNGQSKNKSQRAINVK